MRKHNNFELLLHAAAEEYMEKRAEEFSELDTSEVADQIRMRDRARKLMVRSQKRYRTKVLKIVAVACLAALILATTACLSISEIREIFDRFPQYVRVSTPIGLAEAYRLRDALISQMTYLTAMKAYVEAGGKSRGSAIYTSKKGEAPAKLGDLFRFELDAGEFDETVLEVSYTEGLKAENRPIRPLPGDSGFFENVWRRYREDKNVY